MKAQIKKIKTEVYTKEEARVAPVRPQAPVMGTLKMKARKSGLKEELGIQAQLIKEEREEKDYLAWVEARSTRRQVEEAWEKQFSQASLKEASEMLARVSEELAEGAAYVAVVGHGRSIKFNLGKTWVEELYGKKA